MRDSYILYMDKLEGEYKDTFKQIDHYVSAERIDEDTQEEYMGALLDVFLLAQQEGKPVSKIVGTDMERFCKSFCEDFSWKNKILGAVDTWKNFAWIIFGLSALDVISVLYAMGIPGGREIDFWTEPCEFNFIGYFLAFIVASIFGTVFGRLVRNAMFRRKKVSIRLWQGINWVGTAVIFLLMFVIPQGTDMMQFPAWVLMLVSGLVLVVYYVLNHTRVKERKETKIKFWDKVAEDVAVEVPNTKLKRYELKNRRRLRRGKPALSWKEYVLAEEKEYKLGLKLEWVGKALALLIVGAWIAIDISNQEYESWMEPVITFGVAIPFFLWWIKNWDKCMDASASANKEWIEEERKKIQEAEEENDER